MLFIKNLAFLPLLSATRVTKRETADPIISDIQSAVEFYGLNSKIAAHGCHCRILEGLENYGSPIDTRDDLCRSWKSARTCVSLQGGSCNGVEDTSYDASSGCGALSGCQKALCEIDFSFQSSISEEQTALVNNEFCERNVVVKKDSCCGNSPSTYRQFDSEKYSCDSGSLSLAECQVKLVRQTGTDKFHPAFDNLAGTDVYGQEGTDNTFSIQFDWMNPETFIFATKDHQYFQAMTTEDIGGDFTGQYYANNNRNFYSLQPGFTQWESGSARMYNRKPNPEDPWISLRDHSYPGNKNQMMYGESGYSGTWHKSHMQAHGGLQVYVLTKGNFQDCIVEGGVGQFKNGVYELREE